MPSRNSVPEIREYFISVGHPRTYKVDVPALLKEIEECVNEMDGDISSSITMYNLDAFLTEV